MVPNPNSMCRGPKTKIIMYDLDENDDFDREMIATYEEVSKLYPRPGVYRPIVLIGAPGVGRNELKRRLVDRDAEKFRSPVPCKCDGSVCVCVCVCVPLGMGCSSQTLFRKIRHVRYDMVKCLEENICLCHVTKWRPT